ncbi:flavin reductase family protein [Micromonospora sp. DT228]|uniref:flavin reductase family protein n=1 Tax=Micromonospora sp. DT228 TaxID=3393443 RepID=UPI003CF922E8
MNPPAPTVEPDQFRHVLGHFGTGVTTVTALDPASDRPVGLTVNSFASGDLDWELSPGGAPVLAGVVAWLEGTVEAEHDAGDHVIVVLRVHHPHGRTDGQPLLFLRGRYGRFAH